MTFNWTINEQDCVINVTHYQPRMPIRITGGGYGDCDPPEPEEFEFELLHTDFTPCPELHGFLTDSDEIRIMKHYLESYAYEHK